MLRTVDLELEVGDEPDFLVRRRFEMGRVALRWVLAPKGVFTLRARGIDPVQGVHSDVIALQIYDTRSGDVLTERVFR
ncbi:MAG: hypothetical protein HC923_06225 [Myxococcales bacterium]|nr:hypothetical protein [Myxococcales bacterium]